METKISKYNTILIEEYLNLYNETFKTNKTAETLVNDILSIRLPKIIKNLNKANKVE